jgi:hypothetical protein
MLSLREKESNRKKGWLQVDCWLFEMKLGHEEDMR